VTWAINGSEDNGVDPSVNYSVRVLGRRGTMNVDLVLDPKDMAKVEPVFNSIMSGFRFSGGNRYADFVSGDKVAGYGLTALIAGGAGAAAVKSGLLAKFWKFIVLIFAAIAAYIKRLWAKIKNMFSGGKNQEIEHLSPEVGILASNTSGNHGLSTGTPSQTQGNSDHVGD